jgi:outer membrane lipoprotein-sorting protein
MLLAAILAIFSPVSMIDASPQSQVSSEAALNQVLKQMEVMGRTFKTFQAQFSQKKYTSVLKEFDTPETGEFFYEKSKDGSALLRQEVSKPGKRILTIKGGQAVIYQPSLNQAQMINLGKNKDKAEYLALGLGQSPGKLKETFEISYGGVENVGSSACSILVLKPRNASAAAYFSTITIWIKKTSGAPVQQKLQEPNGDYLLVSFTQEKINAPIPASRFEQKLPTNAEILKIQ